MKKEKIKFARMSAMFIVVTITSLLIFSFLFNTLILSKYSVYQKEIQFENYKQEYDNQFNYIFFGDSRTFDGIDASQIPVSYNYGTDGENYIKTYFKLRKLYQQDGIKIKYVVLEMGVHSLSSSHEKDKTILSDLWHYGTIANYQEIESIRNINPIKYYLEKYHPYIGKGEFIIDNLRKPTTNNIAGWKQRTADFSKRNREELTNRAIASHFEGENVLGKQMTEYFIKTLVLAQEHNSTIILLQIPISQDYNNAVEEAGISKEQFYKKVTQLTDKYVEEKPIMIDLHNIFFDKPEYFHDSHHLNTQGAREFTRILASELSSIENKT